MVFSAFTRCATTTFNSKTFHDSKIKPHDLWTVTSHSPYLQHLVTTNLLFFFFFSLFGCIRGMWKFPGQGSNSCHSSDLSPYRDGAASLTHFIAREAPSLLFVSMYLPTLNISYQWKHKACDLFWLLSKMFSKFIELEHALTLHSFWRFIVHYTHMPQFTHSSVDGCLGCFHL